jgi:hypothetical protein
MGLGRNNQTEKRMRCYHPTDLGRSCGFCLNCQTMADIRAYDDARDADLMS